MVDIIGLISFENNVRKICRNWIKVSLYVMKDKYPIKLNLGGGDIEKAEDFHDITSLISPKKFSLIFGTRKGVGDFFAVFITEEYKFP
jgi:hypothetical protein